MIINVEDIYPLTIIKMRYGGAILIFKAEIECAPCIDALQGEEEISYDIDGYMSNTNIKFGKGATIAAAFEDFQRRYCAYPLTA